MTAHRLPDPYVVLVVTVPVAADLLGMSRRAAYRAADTGELPTITLAGAIRVPVGALYTLLDLPMPPPTGPPPPNRRPVIDH